VRTAPAEGLGLVVLDVLPGSAAAAAGLERGDRRRPRSDRDDGHASVGRGLAARAVVAVTDAAGRTFPQATLERRARWTGDVVVLVNARNASCAEFLARDLQRAGATVVGERTAGAAASTTAFLARAVVPDVVVVDAAMALTEGRDPVLEAALEVLGGAR